jgi:hypothetical protein
VGRQLLADNKKPAEAGFSWTIRILSGAVLAMVDLP